MIHVSEFLMVIIMALKKDLVGTSKYSVQCDGNNHESS